MSLPEAPDVSIIIPAFNVSATIERTIRSILAQTHVDFELIVVDDSSEDGTFELARSFEATDPRVRVFTKEHGGVAAARNFGAGESRGAWLGFIDADDLWAPTALECLLAARKDSRTALIYGWSRRIDGEDRVLADLGGPGFAGDVWVHMVSSNFLRNASSCLIDRQAFAAVGGFDPGLRAKGSQGAEDLKLYLRLAAHGEVAVAPRYLIGYRTSQNAMSKGVERMRRSIELVLEDCVREKPTPAPLLNVARCNYDLYAANLALGTHDRRLFTRYFGRALRRSPFLALKLSAGAALAKIWNAIVVRPARRPFYDCDPDHAVTPRILSDMTETILERASRDAVRAVPD